MVPLSANTESPSMGVPMLRPAVPPAGVGSTVWSLPVPPMAFHSVGTSTNVWLGWPTLRLCIWMLERMAAPSPCTSMQRATLVVPPNATNWYVS